MQAETVHPARGIGRVAIALALICAALLGGASQASALASPNVFLMKTQNLELVVKNHNLKFEGHSRFYLHTSNDEADQMRVRVSGRITLGSAGCAQLRVRYLDGNGAQVAMEHSDLVSNLSGESAVIGSVREFSFSPDYRNVRVELLHGLNCSNVAPVSFQTTDAKLQMSTLGDGERWVSGVRRAGSDINYQNALAADLRVQFNVATNPAPTADRGDVDITATLSVIPNTEGCAILHAEYRDSNNQPIATAQSDCLSDPQKIKMPNFASDAELHSVKLWLESRVGDVGQISTSQTHYLE